MWIKTFWLLGLLLVPFAAQADAYSDMLAAVRAGNLPAIQGLLAKGVDVDSTDRAGSTLLMLAATAGQLESAKVLVEAKAKVDARNQFGDQVVEYLLSRGAEVNPPGWTPLMFAAVRGHADIARLLLAKGAKVDASSENGTTALMLAAKEGSLDTVLLLLEHGAAVNLRNLAGATALRMALDGGHKNVANALLRAGAEQ
jgi:ankyrin repeat protein